MSDSAIVLLLLVTMQALRLAVIWRQRRSGAHDRPPPKIDGRRIFRRHPAVIWATVLLMCACVVVLYGADTSGSMMFWLAVLVAGVIVPLTLGIRYVLSDDQLEMQLFGRTRQRIALSEITRVRPAGFWRPQTLVRRTGKEFLLPADIMGADWLIDRVAPRIAPQTSQ